MVWGGLRARVSEKSMSSRETMKAVNFMTRALSSMSVNLTPLADQRLCSSERVISNGLVWR